MPIHYAIALVPDELLVENDPLIQVNDDLRLTWILIQSMPYTINLSVQNLQPVNRDINFTTIFSDCDFNTLTDVAFYEWKPIDRVVFEPIWEPMNDTDDRLVGYTEKTISVVTWKPCKSQFFQHTAKEYRENYGLINIPKYGSKPKDATVNGTKWFQLRFTVPMTDDRRGWGASGRVAVQLDGSTFDPWYSSSWLYRKSHVLLNATGAGTDYQMMVTTFYGSGSDSGSSVYLNDHCRTDFGDIRFTDNDGITLLSLWNMTCYASDNATFWFKVIDDLSSSNVTVYLYYGNSGVSTVSDGSATFIEYFDMEGIDGNAPPDFTDSSSANCEFVVSGTQAHTLNKSARCYDNNNNGWSLGDLTNDVAADFQALTCFGYFPQTTQIGYVYLYATGTTTLIAIYGASSDGNIYAYDGTSATVIVAGYLTDHWYRFEVIFDYSNHQYDLYVDGVLEADDFGFYTAAASACKSLRFISGKTHASAVEYWYWDDIFDRKYVSPEPSHGAWGSEEVYGWTVYFYYTSGSLLLVNGTKTWNGTYGLYVNASVMELQGIINHSYTVTNYNITTTTPTYIAANPYNYTVLANTTIWLIVASSGGGGLSSSWVLSGFLFVVLIAAPFVVLAVKRR